MSSDSSLETMALSAMQNIEGEAGKASCLSLGVSDGHGNDDWRKPFNNEMDRPAETGPSDY